MRPHSALPCVDQWDDSTKLSAVEDSSLPRSPWVILGWEWKQIIWFKKLIFYLRVTSKSFSEWCKGLIRLFSITTSCMNILWSLSKSIPASCPTLWHASPAVRLGCKIRLMHWPHVLKNFHDKATFNCNLQQALLNINQQPQTRVYMKELYFENFI